MIRSADAAGCQSGRTPGVHEPYPPNADHGLSERRPTTQARTPHVVFARRLCTSRDRPVLSVQVNSASARIGRTGGGVGTSTEKIRRNGTIRLWEPSGPRWRARTSRDRCGLVPCIRAGSRRRVPRGGRVLRPQRVPDHIAAPRGASHEGDDPVGGVLRPTHTSPDAGPPGVPCNRLRAPYPWIHGKEAHELTAGTLASLLYVRNWLQTVPGSCSPPATASFDCSARARSA